MHRIFLDFDVPVSVHVRMRLICSGGAVYLLSDVSKWKTNVSLYCDLLFSQGKLTQLLIAIANILK